MNRKGAGSISAPMASATRSTDFAVTARPASNRPHNDGCLNPDLLYLLQGEHIRGPVIELGRSRGGVRGDGLRLLDHSPVLQVGVAPTVVSPAFILSTQWEWELRLVNLEDGSAGDETPVCLGGRGASPPQYCGGPAGYRLMRKRQELGESMCMEAEVETVIGLLTAAHPDQPVTSFELLRTVVADGCRSLDRLLPPSLC